MRIQENITISDMNSLYCQHKILSLKYPVDIKNKKKSHVLVLRCEI
jgi:hypothetical protein